MIIRSIFKRLIPSKLKSVVRSYLCSRKLGLVRMYVATVYNLPKSERLGTEYGGWVIPQGRLQENDLCYCVGCGEDISFDLELIKKYNTTVIGVDPTPRSIDYVQKTIRSIPRYTLNKYALWTDQGIQKFYEPKNEGFVSHSLTSRSDSDSYIEVETIRLLDLLRQNGHEKLKLLKLDIEGAESTVIDTIVKDEIKIDIVCIEFDELAQGTRQATQNVRNAVNQLLRSGYKLFWIESLNFTFVRQ